MDRSSSNGPQVFSTEVGENEIDYKQRCKYLENQLEKFREQATKVREVIGQKVCDLSSVVASLLKWHAAVEFAKTHQCTSVLFVSLFLFSLFSSRFRIIQVILREIFKRSSVYKSTVCTVGMFVFKLCSTADSESTSIIFSRLHSKSRYTVLYRKT